MILLTWHPGKGEAMETVRVKWLWRVRGKGGMNTQSTEEYSGRGAPYGTTEMDTYHTFIHTLGMYTTKSEPNVNYAL